MLLVRKEIRIVALMRFKPEGIELDEWVDQLASKGKHCHIIYDHTNKHDKNCMVAMVEGLKIGYVNAEDQRFVEPLLRKCPMAEATFFEIYKSNSTSILRYRVKIDMDEVQKFVPGLEWEAWEYHGPVFRELGIWSSIPYEIDVIMKEIKQDNPDEHTMQLYLDMLASDSQLDMSYETTEALESIAYMMEMEHSEPFNTWKNRIQLISSKRRSMKRRREKIEAWWQEFLRGEEAVDLFRDEMKRLKCLNIDNKEFDISAQLLAKLNDAEKALNALPYGLNMKVDDFPQMYADCYYTKMPRAKQRELLSAIIMCHWIREILDGKVTDGDTKILMLGDLTQLTVVGNYNNIHDNKFY